MPFSNSYRSLQRPESGKIKLLNRSHSILVILTFHVDQQQQMKHSILYRHELLRRTGHSMLRDWNMDKVHEVGWCMAAALKAAQRASKSSWSLACSSCFPVWFSAELLDEGCSFSDLLCMLRSASRSLGQGQMKADIASVAF